VYWNAAKERGFKNQLYHYIKSACCVTARGGVAGRNSSTHAEHDNTGIRRLWSTPDFCATQTDPVPDPRVE